jgi:hypothetical protein
MQSPVIIEPPARIALAASLSGVLFIVLVSLATGIVRRFLEGEDGFVENVSAIAYAAACIVALSAARESSGRTRGHWIMWAVLSFLFFGEETSWLQHWLGYATPESVKLINVQSEFNLHNLRAVSPDDRIFSGAGVAFSWKHLLSAQQLFNLGFTAYFLLLPLLMMIEPLKFFMRRHGVPELRSSFLMMVWTPIGVSIAFTIANRSHESLKSLIGETREMFFALTILWFVAAAYVQLRTQKTAVESPDIAVARA